jgi:CRISPR-associated protein Cmr1
MPTLTVTLKTITPLFLGGAEPNDFAELRPPAIKGLLRFWYRALDPNYQAREGKIFGGTGAMEGQSSFRLQLESPIRGKMRWDLDRYRGAPFQKGGSQGAPPKNGFLYLGFPLRLGGNDRKAIPPGESFLLVNRFSTFPTEQIRKAVLSAWWLLGHFGGLGTRARRGFGTVALQRWEGEGEWSEIKALPIAHGARNPDEWIDRVKTAVNTMRSWFKEFPADEIDHTTIAGGTRLYLHTQGFDGGAKAWEQALEWLGVAMRDFRQRRQPDYSAVKAHLVKRGIVAAERKGKTPPQAPPGVIPQFLSSSPQRAAFGLPLTFRYRSLSDFPSTTTFRPALHERSASPILLRVVEIQGRAHPLVIRLRAPVPGSDDGVVEEKGRHVVLTPTSGQILEDFCSYLKTKGFREVLL